MPGLRHLLTRIGRALAECEWRLVALPLMWLIARIYRIDLSDCRRTRLRDYKSFQDLFTRELRPEARLWQPPQQCLSSPADGVLVRCEKLSTNGDEKHKIKGLQLTLGELLGCEATAQEFAGGLFVENYLAPANYHRFHTPCAGTLKEVRYLGTDLRSVSLKAVQKYPQTYAINERAALRFANADKGDFLLIAVAALMVGGIAIADIPRVNSDSNFAHLEGKTFKQGDELGMFRYGSTILQLWQADAGWKPTVNNTPCKVRIGDILAD